MQVKFDRTKDNSYHSVRLVEINGRPITPVTVYATNKLIHAQAVHAALTSGILTRITVAITTSGVI